MNTYVLPQKKEGENFSFTKVVPAMVEIPLHYECTIGLVFDHSSSPDLHSLSPTSLHTW
jgi:hypothetical protein